jgi:hypothetical protein
VIVVSDCTCIFGTDVLLSCANGLRYFDFGGVDDKDEMLVWTGLLKGSSSEVHSIKWSPRVSECDRLRPLPSRSCERTADPRCTPLPAELNLRATMSSSTDLKSSRNMVSDAHLKTSANLQYGFMPLLAVSLAALTTTSVSRKAIDVTMQSIMMPNRVLIRINAHSLNP